MKPLLLALLGAVLLLAGCSRDETGGVDAKAVSPREPGHFLTRDEAVYRQRVIHQPEYALFVDLARSPDSFAGTVDMQFTYSGGARPLTIDFRNGEVLSVASDGAPLDYDYNGFFITLRHDALPAGPARLTIEYEAPFSDDGAGLYRYEDPQDGRIYLYTDFQPYEANRLFPHFDQPDLKARYSLTVLAPAHWEVVSTTRETAATPEGGSRRWVFPATEPLSSYVFSLHAGEYAVFEDAGFRYPLRLFVRESLKEYARPQFWFEVTRQGFDFFDDYFGLPYPFGKYDQLIVPDFIAGAMENVAAVTFNESRLSRGEFTQRERLDAVNVIMHEMAHMWFGNIATMAWWNGLWLNESFATLMEQLASVEGAGFTESWHEFFNASEQWAYREDQLVTTHPIELPVRDTEEAVTNFDGITYGKGAAVLKQLNFLLGEEVFRQGVRDYLAAMAWANTELEDFIAAMATAAGRDLGEWTRKWLYTAGLNTAQVEFQCEAGLVTGMSLLQSAPREHPTLREHRTLVALYRLEDDALALDRVIPVLFEAARTPVREAEGANCPDFVYPNYQDHAYVKVELDPRSLATVSEHIGGLTDPLQRSMAWYDLFSMVRDAKLELTRYLDILAANLGAEADLNVASSLLGNLRSSFGWLYQIPQGAELLPREAARFEALLWQLLEGSEGDARQLWLSGYINTANNETAFSRLEGLLTGDTELEGLQLDQDQRWLIVLKLNEHRWPGHRELALAEAVRDPSSIGKSLAMRAEVLAARGEAKYGWMQSAIARDENYSLQRSRDIVASLFPQSSQRTLAEPFAVEMLAQLPELDREWDVVFHDRVTRYLLPRLCTAENVKRLRHAAERYSDLSPAIVRGIKVAAQLDQRCVNIGLRIETARRAAGSVP